MTDPLPIKCLCLPGSDHGAHFSSAATTPYMLKLKEITHSVDETGYAPDNILAQRFCVASRIKMVTSMGAPT